MGRPLSLRMTAFAPRRPRAARLAVWALVLGSITTTSATLLGSLVASDDHPKSAGSDDDEFEYVAGAIAKVSPSHAAKNSPELNPLATTVPVPHLTPTQLVENVTGQLVGSGSGQAAATAVSASVAVGTTQGSEDGDCWPNCAKVKGMDKPALTADVDCFPFCDEKGKEHKPAAVPATPDGPGGPGGPALKLISVANKRPTGIEPASVLNRKNGTLITQHHKSIAETWVESEDLRELQTVISNAKGFKTFEQKAFPEQLKKPKDNYTPEQAQAWHAELEAFERLKKVALHRKAASHSSSSHGLQS